MAGHERSLPGHTVDLIRDGVDGQALRLFADKAVWMALVKTAMSAHRAGWSYPQWQALVSEPKSRLGVQARRRDGRALTQREYHRQTQQVWATAEVACADFEPAYSKQEAQAEAHRRANDVLDWCADPDAPLQDRDRALLAHIAERAITYSSLTPAVPKRAVMEALDLTDYQVRAGLRRLVDVGLLTVANHGRVSSNPAKRKATTYRLPSKTAREEFTVKEKTTETPPSSAPMSMGDSEQDADRESPTDVVPRSMGDPSETNPATGTGGGSITFTVDAGSEDLAAALVTAMTRAMEDFEVGKRPALRLVNGGAS